MKKLLFLAQIFWMSVCAQSYVTPKFSARFGDKLSCIYNTLCCSYKYDLIFICPEFEYSDELKIHDIVPKLSNKKFSKVINIKKVSDIKKLEENILYRVDYYLNFNFSKEIHEKALNRFKQLISPKKIIEDSVQLDTTKINVAVHVRKGGGYDAPLFFKSINIKNSYADLRWPLKFPPDSYYIEQIKNLFLILKKQPLHVYIFTDDINPKKIVNKYKNIIKEPLISFSCNQNNNFKETTIHDFFFMSKFDCLIRPQSSFSINAERIGKFRLVIFPIYGYSDKQKNFRITQVQILKK